MGATSLGNQCLFEADIAHLVRGHDLSDSEVSAFQDSENLSPRREREEKERVRSSSMTGAHAHILRE